MTEAAIERYEAPAALGPPGPNEWAAIRDQAMVLSRSSLVPRQLRGRAEDIMVVALVGRELGIPPMTALNKVHVIEGSPTLAAEVMLGLVRRAGHSVKGEATTEKATATGTRADNGDTFTATWTIEQAKTAELLGKKNWRTYPKAMLWARAVAELCRELFSDVLMGYTYTPEELGATVDEEGHVIEAQVAEEKPSSPLPLWIQDLLAKGYKASQIIAAAQEVAKTHSPDVRVESLEDIFDAPEDAIGLIREELGNQGVGEGQAEVADSAGVSTREAGPPTAGGSPSEPSQAAEPSPAEHPCPECGAECLPFEGRSKKAPKWKCSNQSCTGGKDGKPWASWRNDPWKPGGPANKTPADEVSGPPSEAGSDGEGGSADVGQGSSEGEPSQPVDWYARIDQAREASLITWADVERAQVFAVSHFDEFTPARGWEQLEKKPAEVHEFIALKLKLDERLMV